MAREIRLKAVFFFALALLGFAVYWNVLSAPFVFDDFVYIVDNKWIRSLENFANPFPMRYVGDLSFALNYKISGLDAPSFHLVNVSIHVVNSVLVFLLADKLLAAASMRGGGLERNAFSFLIPASTAALFLVHPINTQAVAYVTQRYTVLAAFFYLSSVILYLHARLSPAGGRGRGRFFYAASVIAAVLAMKTKEVSFTLPFVIAFIEVSLFRATRQMRVRLLRPFFITLLIIPVSLLVENSGSKADELMRLKKIGDIQYISSWSYLLTQSKVVLMYIKLLFYPANLHFNYHFPLSESILETRVLAAVTVVVAVISSSFYLFVRSLKKDLPLLVLAFFGVLWFFATLSVESSVMPIRDAVNEHRLYLPSTGIFLASVSVLFYLAGFLSERGLRLRAAAFAAVMAAVAVLSVSACKRVTVWSDDLVLYTDDVRKNPFEPSPWINLANAYAGRGRLDEAARGFIKALEFEPDHPVARANLASTYLKLGQVDDAMKEYLVLAELSPEKATPHLNLGLIYMEKGLLTEAEAELTKVLKLDPGNKKAELALEHLRKGRADEIEIRLP